MTSFRESLMGQLLSRYVHFLEEVATRSSGGDNEEFGEIKVRLDSTSSCSSSSASPPGKELELVSVKDYM